MSASSLYILLYLAGLQKSLIERFGPFLTSRGWFLGLDLFPNKFHNLLIYTNNFCFGYISVSWFLETFPGGRVAGWLGGRSENLILMKTQSSVLTWTWSLDFDLGFVKRTSIELLMKVLQPLGSIINKTHQRANCWRKLSWNGESNQIRHPHKSWGGH